MSNQRFASKGKLYGFYRTEKGFREKESSGSR